jgi:hypothetical protein
VHSKSRGYFSDDVGSLAERAGWQVLRDDLSVFEKGHRLIGAAPYFAPRVCYPSAELFFCFGFVRSSVGEADVPDEDFPFDR